MGILRPQVAGQAIESRLVQLGREELQSVREEGPSCSNSVLPTTVDMLVECQDAGHGKMPCIMKGKQCLLVL